MKDKANIEITTREAALIRLLRSVPIPDGLTMENAGAIMKTRLEIDALIEKADKAFGEDGQAAEAAQTPAVSEPHGSKRKRH